MKVSFVGLSGQRQALRDVYGQTLVELCDRYSTLMVLDGDLASSTKADIVERQRPSRFLQMGIAEQNMIGVAAGLATLGFIPWISTFAVFLAKRALDQIRLVVAQTRLGVKLAGSYSGLLTGLTGKSHQSVQDLAIMRGMPGITVIAPADGPELRQAMVAATEMPGPVYIRVTRDPSPVIFNDRYQFQVGRTVELLDGPDIALISTGVQTTRVLEAAELLARDGIRPTVLHVPTLKPLDREAIVRVAARTGLVVTAEDHSIIGGLGSAVAEALAEELPTRLGRVGIRDVFGESAPNDALLEKYGLTPAHVADAARTMLAKRNAAVYARSSYFPHIEIEISDHGHGVRKARGDTPSRPRI